MKALRIHVERVVRPIRASNQRKDRVREEWLAHLTRLFQEELARGGDAQAATAAAIRRFGEVATLKQQLQASVPWLERWAFCNLGGPIRRRKGETHARYLLRNFSWGGGVGVVAMALLAAVVLLLPNHRPQRADQVSRGAGAFFIMCTAAIQAATMFVQGFASEYIRQEMERRAVAATVAERSKSLRRIIGYTVLSSVTLGAAPAGLMLLIEGLIPVPLVTRSWFWGITLGAAALGPLIVLKQAIDWRTAVRRFDAWESLDLDEPETT